MVNAMASDNRVAPKETATSRSKPSATPGAIGHSRLECRQQALIERRFHLTAPSSRRLIPDETRPLFLSIVQFMKAVRDFESVQVQLEARPPPAAALALGEPAKPVRRGSR